MEVRNRFKGLDLIDRVPEELWMEIYKKVQDAVIKTISKKKKCKKAKWLSEETYKVYNRPSQLPFTKLGIEEKRKAKAKGKDIPI